MFSGFETSEDSSYNCLKHGSSKVIYFCANPQCYESLCSACKVEHHNAHVKSNTDCFILSFPIVLSETKQKIRKAIRYLNTLIQSSRTSVGPTTSNTEASPLSNNYGKELQDIRKEYKEVLKKLQGADMLKELKTSYGKDYEAEIENLKLKHGRKSSGLGEANRNRLSFQPRQEFGGRRPVQGLRFIVEELREIGNLRGQPLQNGTEEDESDDDDDEEEEEEKPYEAPVALKTQKKIFIPPLEIKISKFEDQSIPDGQKTFHFTGSDITLTPIEHYENSDSALSKFSNLSSYLHQDRETINTKSSQNVLINRLAVLRRTRTDLPSICVNGQGPVNLAKHASADPNSSSFFDYEEIQNSFDHSAYQNWDGSLINSFQVDGENEGARTFRD